MAKSKLNMHIWVLFDLCFLLADWSSRFVQRLGPHPAHTDPGLWPQQCYTNVMHHRTDSSPIRGQRLASEHCLLALCGRAETLGYKWTMMFYRPGQAEKHTSTVRQCCLPPFRTKSSSPSPILAIGLFIIWLFFGYSYDLLLWQLQECFL